MGTYKPVNRAPMQNCTPKKNCFSPDEKTVEIIRFFAHNYRYLAGSGQIFGKMLPN